MPETDFIIQCSQCGPRVMKASVTGDLASEAVRDSVRALLTKEHAFTHRAFKCREGHEVSPPDWATNNRGDDFDGCRAHNHWVLRSYSRSDG